MKASRFFVLNIFLLVMVFGFSIQVHAALQNIGTDNLGNQLIYDDDFDITWYDYSNSADTWWDQMDWADGLSVDFGGTILNDWRLPTALNHDNSGICSGYNCPGSEMGHLYFTELGNIPYPDAGYGFVNTGDFQNFQASKYWSGTDNGTYIPNAWSFITSMNGLQDYNGKAGDRYAMAVMNGMAVVPEPISSILFVTGGTLLAGRRFTKRKKIA